MFQFMNTKLANLAFELYCTLCILKDFFCNNETLPRPLYSQVWSVCSVTTRTENVRLLENSEPAIWGLLTQILSHDATRYPGQSQSIVRTKKLIYSRTILTTATLGDSCCCVRWLWRHSGCQGVATIRSTLNQEKPNSLPTDKRHLLILCIL